MKLSMAQKKALIRIGWSKSSEIYTNVEGRRWFNINTLHKLKGLGLIDWTEKREDYGGYITRRSHFGMNGGNSWSEWRADWRTVFMGWLTSKGKTEVKKVKVARPELEKELMKKYPNEKKYGRG